MSQDPIAIKQGCSVQEIWAEALALHLGFPFAVSILRISTLLLSKSLIHYSII
jgi:hypothetical protein